LTNLSLVQALLPDRHRRAIVSLFFGCLLAIGLGLFRDYSLPGDEEIQRVTGEVSLFYIFQKLPSRVQQKLVSPKAAALIAQKGQSTQLRTYRDRDYGVAFELPAAAIEQASRIDGTREKFLLRHALNFLVCLAGVGAFYTLAARRFRSWRVGLLGALLLVASPRLFADFFYNSKDAVFLAAFTGAVATAVPFIKRPTWRGALTHAFVCALAIDVRLMGTLVPAATLAFIALQAIRAAYTGRPVLAIVGVYSGLLVALVVAMWPFLWEAPLTNFVAAWRAMSNFVRAPGEILYWGQKVSDTNLPWHYTLVWIGITVPILYLLLWAGGTLSILWKVAQRRIRLYASESEWQDLLFLGLCLSPVVTVILLHSVLYNGWRQLYFLYPMLLLVAIRGLLTAWHWQPAHSIARRYWQPTLLLVIAGSLAIIMGRMVRLHPLENLYFNAFAPMPVNHYYETDYWGLGLRNGLEWVAQHDSRAQIRVYSTNNWALIVAHGILPLKTRSRLTPVLNEAQADYLLDSSLHGRLHRSTAPLHILWADNVHVLDIYKLN
jgi:hypothetical protein